MLRCGPSNRTFVHFAAFLLAETSVCRTKLPFARCPISGAIAKISSTKVMGRIMIPDSMNNQNTFDLFLFRERYIYSMSL
jgi:hypothetical protein